MKKVDVLTYLDAVDSAPKRAHITDLFSEPTEIDANYWIDSFKSHLANATYLFIAGATTKIDQLSGLRDLAVSAMTADVRAELSTRYREMLTESNGLDDVQNIAAAGLLTRNLSPLNALYAASGQPIGVELIREARADVISQHSAQRGLPELVQEDAIHNQARKMQ